MGETQERERVLAHFSQRYFQCNPEALSSEGEQVGSRVVPSVATEARTHTQEQVFVQEETHVHVCKACEMQLHACRAVHVAGMLLGQRCSGVLRGRWRYVCMKSFHIYVLDQF